MNSNQVDLKELASIIFNKEIKEKSYYSVQFDSIENLNDLYENLLMFFTEGMKILFGINGKVDLFSLTSEDFVKFNKYMNSIGINCIFNIYDESEYDKMFKENFMIKIKKTLSDYRFKIKIKNKIFVLFFEII